MKPKTGSERESERAEIKNNGVSDDEENNHPTANNIRFILSSDVFVNGIKNKCGEMISMFRRLL